MNFLAGPKEIWVCGTCRRSGKDRKTIGGECCFLHAILCDDGSLIKNNAGRVVDCQAAGTQTFRAAKEKT